MLLVLQQARGDADAAGTRATRHLRVFYGLLACAAQVGETFADVKLSDLGAARNVKSKEDYTYIATTDHLPARWMPLEAIRDAAFSHKSDVFSFGVRQIPPKLLVSPMLCLVSEPLSHNQDRLLGVWRGCQCTWSGDGWAATASSYWAGCYQRRSLRGGGLESALHLSLRLRQTTTHPHAVIVLTGLGRCLTCAHCIVKLQVLMWEICSLGKPPWGAFGLTDILDSTCFPFLPTV